MRRVQILGDFSHHLEELISNFARIQTRFESSLKIGGFYSKFGRIYFRIGRIYFTILTAKNFTQFSKRTPIKSILIHEYQYELTRVNTNQHKSKASQHKSNTSQHGYIKCQHEYNTSQHESNTSQHESSARV